MNYVNNLFIITHNDLDGMGGAAAFMRILEKSPEEVTTIFAEPYNLDFFLENVSESIERGDLLVITDIGSNNSIFENVCNAIKKIISKGARIEGYDHHVWDQNDIEKLSALGVEIFIDTETCGTGVVAKYAQKKFEKHDEFLKRLEKAVCSADLWKWDDELGGKLYRVSYTMNKGIEWKHKIIKKFYEGVLWDNEMQSHLEEYMREELNNFDSILSTLKSYGNRCKISAVYKDKEIPSDSLVGAMLLSRENASIAIIIKRKTARRVSLSLRSRGKANVQVIARELGGGGHPMASGASILLPWYVTLLSTFSKSFIIKYVLKKIYLISTKNGSCLAT